MANKIYVLLAHTNSTAPIFRRVNQGQRVRMEKRPLDHAYLKNTFFDQSDADETKWKNRTTRLKLSSNTIYQDEQIKEGIPANEPFTQGERDAVKFVYGRLITGNTIVQKYLETSPQYDKFKGKSDDITRPLFTLYEPANETKIINDSFRKSLRAANKIAEIDDLKEAQELMYYLNGSFFKAPGTEAVTDEEKAEALEECRRGLIAFLDDTDDAGLDRILDSEISSDDSAAILVGKAVAGGFISFDAKPNMVSVKKGGGWGDAKMIASTTDPEERQRIFVEFLGSKDGSKLLDDLKKRVKQKELATA